MKKTVAIFFSFLLSLSMYGCKMSESTPVTSMSTESKVSEASNASNGMIQFASPGPYFDGLVAYGTKTLFGVPITETQTVSFLEVEFSLRPSRTLEIIDPLYTGTLWNRVNALPYGLSRFCPTISFVFSNGGKYDSFIDIFVREKDGSIGENYSPLTCFLGVKLEEPIGLHTMTIDSYHDAADFFQKNFAAAESGQDSEFGEFELLESEVAKYHYSFSRSEKAYQATELTVCEQYGEHYIFETDRYIYLFAFSGIDADAEQLTAFHRIIDSVSLATEAVSDPPIWEHSEWIQQHMTGEPKYMSEYYRSHADELEGDLPDCIQVLLGSN